MMEIIESSRNVFKDLGFSQEESDKLIIKSKLMMEIESFIKNKGMTQAHAAELMGVTRPRISDVMRGKIDKFTIDALVDMLSKAGLQVAVTVKHAGA
ncbi:MAG: XRE family transcriptional regulator [Desulfobacter postgatei]|uniref:helix-turn-helix domain-containing protein n=1 Tax=Desulfobacter postgatei TaxID=2293 RepID=UPI0023F34837|nr:XRE family transcriptional regulator [Desulfobacter postgatei]MDD4275086.1 XRE family transcriptional regulator [Desulfobacter postgatei]